MYQRDVFKLLKPVARLVHVKIVWRKSIFEATRKYVTVRVPTFFYLRLLTGLLFTKANKMLVNKCVKKKHARVHSHTPTRIPP